MVCGSAFERDSNHNRQITCSKECSRKRHSERQKVFYQKNPEKRKESNRRYYFENRDKIIKRQSLYARLHGLGGKIRGINKRDYPQDNKCELCSKETKRLVYHHWKIENKMAYGLWICSRCHWLAEGCEKDLDKKYRELKLTINAMLRAKFN